MTAKQTHKQATNNLFVMLPSFGVVGPRAVLRHQGQGGVRDVVVVAVEAAVEAAGGVVAVEEALLFVVEMAGEVRGEKRGARVRGRRWTRRGSGTA